MEKIVEIEGADPATPPARLRSQDVLHHENFERLPITIPISLNQCCIGRVRWPRVEWPFLWPVSVPAQDRPNHKASRMAVTVRIWMNSEEQFERVASESHDVL